MKNQIYEFNPVIYPCRIWIGINIPFEDVKNKFYALATNMERIEFEKNMYQNNRFIIATNFQVASKDDGWIGIFIPIFKKWNMDVKTIAHEASHAADFFCEEFGITSDSFEHGEARAYLLGWIADCINQVKTNKFK